MTNCYTKRYPNSYSPLKVKNIIFSNRFVGTPMVNIPTHILLSSTDYGSVSLWDRSLGGLAAIALEYHGKARNGENMYEANGGNPFKDKYSLDVIREELTVAKQGGSLVEMVVGVGCFYEGKQYSPSGTKFGRPVEVRETSEITEEILLKLIDETAEKAKNAIDFGFDYIGIDMSGDNICGLFMAPGFNHRTDKYGGSYENRFRAAKLALHKIREVVGDNVVIELKISSTLAVKESYSFDEMLRFLKEEENVIDIVSVGNGMDEFHDGAVYAFPVIFLPHNQNKEYAKKIKNETNIIVNLVGSVLNIHDAEEVLENGYADLCLLGRSVIADPYWVKKVAEGYEEDVVPCIRCNNCIHTSTKHRYVACSVNPRYRRENRVPLKLEKTSSPKNVVVIGGGPAGMKAALTALEKGHKVTLIENNNELGGMLNIAQKGLYKGDLINYNNYLKRQVIKSNIKVLLNTTANKALLTNLNPDAIVVAIGSKPISFNFEGLDATNSVQAIDLIKNDFATNAKNIVIIGGGSVGCELAMDLSHYGKKVSIVEMKKELALNGNSQYRDGLFAALDRYNDAIKVYVNSTFKGYKDGKAITNDAGEEKLLDCDLVVLSMGFKNNIDDIYEFYGICNETYYVGDCKHVSNVLEAINDSYFIGANL